MAVGEHIDYPADLLEKLKDDIKSEMIRAQGERHVVTLNGITVEYSPDVYVSDGEAYRLAEKVRALMLAEGLLIRGDFVIRTERPR